MKKLILALALCLLTLGLLAACAPAPVQTTTTAPVPTGHTVTFEGVEGMEPVVVEEGGTLTPPEEPKRMGYTFGGWTADGQPFDFDQVIFSDLTLTAVWIPEEYTVQFFDVSGKLLKTETLYFGDSVTPPTLRLAADQILLGWFTEAGGNGTAFDPDEGAVASVSYYPHVATGMTLTFLDEDGATKVAELKLFVGDKAAAPAAPDKSARNKEFLGWFDANGTAYDPAVAYPASATFTARYLQLYVITFKVAGQTVKQELLEAGAPISAPSAPTTDDMGNPFVAWKDAAGKTLAAGATVSGDATYSAIYAAIYTVTFKDEGGNVVDTQTVAAGESAILPKAPSGYLYDITPAGGIYNVTENRVILLNKQALSDFAQTSFAPTATNADYDKSFTTNTNKVNWGTVLYDIGKELTFTAELLGDVNAYIGPDKLTDATEFLDVEILVDGVVVNRLHMDMSTKKTWVTLCTVADYGLHTVTVRVVDAKIPEVPAKDPQYGVCVLITSVQAYIRKAPVTSYTVTFAGDSVSIPVQTVDIGGKAQKPADPTRDGYRFDGWMLGDALFDFDTVLTGNVTLTAKWTAYMEYTVTFVDADGNSLGTSTVLPGKNATLPAAPAGKYWSFEPADALYNITASKTVSLTAVSGEGYVNTGIDTTTTNPDYKSLFETTGLAKGYATILYREGQTFSYTANMAGAVEMNLRKEKIEAGMVLTVDILVDDVVVNTIIIDSSFTSKQQVVCYVAPGQHTVTVRMRTMEGVPSGNADWGTAAFVTYLYLNQQ